MRDLKCVITGWPCSGTLYVSRVLRQCYGIEATHEGWLFNKSFDMWERHFAGVDTEVDVNHALYQWLDKKPMTEIPVILLMRHPLRVLASWLSKAFRMGQKLDPSDKIAAMISIYNAVSQCDRVVATHRIEDPIEDLIAALPVEPRFTRPVDVPKDTNAKNRGLLRLNWPDIENHCGSAMLYAIARKHDYCHDPK